MTVPVLTLSEAVTEKVQPGNAVYLGNFGSQLFCVGYEIIRQELWNLDVVVASGGLLLDQLFGAGAVRSAVFGHCWSPVGPSAAWNFRRLAESGESQVELHEMSLGMLTAALTAGAWNVPFMPFPGLEETGYLREDWSAGYVGLGRSEFGDQQVVRALTPDVAFVHVDRCDAAGNGVIAGPLGEVRAASSAAAETVIVTEEMVSSDEVLSAGITIPGMVVSAIVVEPGAVAPDGAVGRYDRDVSAYEAYVAAASTSEGFEEWRRSLCTGRSRHG